MIDIQTLSGRDFEGHLNDAFTVLLGPETLQMQLIEVKTMGQGERAGGAFSTLWQGPRSPVLSQGTYEVRHADLGSLAVFLVPVAQKDAGIQYEAIFT